MRAWFLPKTYSSFENYPESEDVKAYGSSGEDPWGNYFPDFEYTASPWPRHESRMLFRCLKIPFFSLNVSPWICIIELWSVVVYTKEKTTAWLWLRWCFAFKLLLSCLLSIYEDGLSLLIIIVIYYQFVFISHTGIHWNKKFIKLYAPCQWLLVCA